MHSMLYLELWLKLQEDGPQSCCRYARRGSRSSPFVRRTLQKAAAGWAKLSPQTPGQCEELARARDRCSCELSECFTVVCDQCQFRLTTKSADGKSRDPAMKPTGFLTTSQQMVECLDKRCDRSHKHQHLSGGRAAEAAFYPLPLIRAILKGMRDTADSETYHRDNTTEQT